MIFVLLMNARPEYSDLWLVTECLLKTDQTVDAHTDLIDKVHFLTLWLIWAKNWTATYTFCNNLEHFYSQNVPFTTEIICDISENKTC